MSYPVQKKIKTGENVLRAAVERINWVFDTFEEICLSFSGGAYFHERRSLNNFHRDRVITFEQIAE